MSCVTHTNSDRTAMVHQLHLALSVLVVISLASSAAAGVASIYEEAAAEQYVANLRVLISTQIVPGLERGILNTAVSRPPALRIEVTDDPSPYAIAARVEADGSLTARLSIGYVTMHDAALDAAALSAELNRRADLRKYLTYQLWLARENHRRRARRERTEHAKSFAEFVGLDPALSRVEMARPAWRTARDRIEVASLGWTVAYVLVRADPGLAGIAHADAADTGEGAARLAGAASWFPVPPLPTAMGLAGITRSPPAWDESAVLCRAAQLMEAGLMVLREAEPWRSRLKQTRSPQRQAAEIRSQIRRMRRDGHCERGGVIAHDERAPDSGGLVPLSELASLELAPGPNQLRRKMASPGLS